MAKYGLPDITLEEENLYKLIWKSNLKSQIRNQIEAKTKEEIEKISKPENIDTEREQLGEKTYLYELDLNQARTKFKLRS